MSSEKCIIDSLGGKTHPYGYCIKPLDEMIDYGKIRRKSGAFNMVGITEGAKGLVNYAGALVTNPSNAISKDCNNQLGNMYVMKTKVKCKNGNTMHKFVDNIQDYNILTQRNDPNIGIVPATIGSATKINPIGIFEAITEDPNPECIQVELPCHIVSPNKDDNTNYSGPSPPVWISKKDYQKLVNQNVINPKTKKPSQSKYLREHLTNLHEILHDNLLQKNNLDKTNEELINNVDDQNILINTYYILFSLLLLFIIFKLTNKK